MNHKSGKERRNNCRRVIHYWDCCRRHSMPCYWCKPILDAPDYLVKISANENQVMMRSALLILIMALACAGIALALYPILKKSQ